MISPRKIGLYGGSFDPVHHGHLILAREVREQLVLDEIVFVPAGISPHKLGRPPVAGAFRLEMVQAAIAGEPGFSCSDCEVRREGPSFAVDTVRAFRAANPGAEIFYFIGEDNLAALSTWKEIDTLRTMARFVVFSRGLNAAAPGMETVCRVVDISSTDIRKRIASGRSVRYLLPETVCAIISRHQLYRNE